MSGGFCVSGPLETVKNPEGATAPLTFERNIRPLLKHHCVHCHGKGEKLKAGLDVRLRRFLVTPHGEGGDLAIVPGKPEESEMLRLVSEGEMPPKGKKLTLDEVQLLERRIAQGAPTASPEPDSVPQSLHHRRGPGVLGV